jgi:hypothetical protein
MLYRDHHWREHNEKRREVLVEISWEDTSIVSRSDSDIPRKQRNKMLSLVDVGDGGKRRVQKERRSPQQSKPSMIWKIGASPQKSRSRSSFDSVCSFGSASTKAHSNITADQNQIQCKDGDSLSQLASERWSSGVWLRFRTLDPSETISVRNS